MVFRGNEDDMSYVEVPGAKVPIRMWADPATVEDGALQQLRNVATLPWIKGLAVMPDVHYGKGATVGSVIAMHGAVCPAAVGVDIGCGMSAVKTSLTANDLPGRPLPAARRRSSRRSRWAAGMHDDPVDPGRLHGFPTGGLGRLLGAVRRGGGGGQVPSGAGHEADGNARLGKPLHRGLPRHDRIPSG